MSKSYFEEPRRGPIALEPTSEPFLARGSVVPPSGPADPRQRVRNDRRDPEPYVDLRVQPSLTGTWFERKGRYRLFINHVGGHLECLLTLVVRGSGYHTERKSLAADERLPYDWGIGGYFKPPKKTKERRDPIAFRFAGDWVSNVYMLTVPTWLSERRLDVSPGAIGTHDLGHLEPRAGGGELSVDFLGWFVGRWPEAEQIFGLDPPPEGGSRANLRTVAIRSSTQPVLLDRYLARASVPYRVRTHYWFPITPRQRANLPELARPLQRAQVHVHPERKYLLAKPGHGGRAMDVYDLLSAARSLGIGPEDTQAYKNIITAIDRIVYEVFEHAYTTPPDRGGLGADELQHLRPYVLRLLEGWCLEPTEEHGRQTLATALQRLVDRAGFDGADYSHLAKYLDISPRGWRGFAYEVEVTAFETLAFDDETTQKKYEVGKKAFDKLKEHLEDAAKKKFQKFAKWKGITKYLPVSYLVGHVRVRYLGVVEGDTGGPQDEPWEAYYGFALGGMALSRSAGDADQSVKMSGRTIVRASTPPTKEDLDGMLSYMEGDLYAGFALGSDSNKGERNDGIALTKSMWTFYGGKQSPAVAFEFGAKLSGGIGGAAVGVQTLAGVAWLLDGGESRIVIEPKATKEVESFESYWQDHVPSLAVHFPINGARLPVPTEAEQARMREQGSISVKEALDAFAACELPLIANPAARIVIDGYADAPGKTEKNKELSYNRATSVFNYLAGILGEQMTAGLDYGQLEEIGRVLAQGLGEPPGPTEKGMEKFNPFERRTDITIQLTTSTSDIEKDYATSISWQLRRANNP